MAGDSIGLVRKLDYIESVILSRCRQATCGDEIASTLSNAQPKKRGIALTSLHISELLCYSDATFFANVMLDI